MIAYITKYALASGIQIVAGHEDGCKYFISRNMPWIGVDHVAPYDLFYNKTEYFANLDDAILRTEEMRNAKIKSLKKQIDKLEKMTFEVKK